MVKEETSAHTLLSVGAWVLIAFSGFSVIWGGLMFLYFRFLKNLGPPGEFERSLASAPTMVRFMFSNFGLMSIAQSILSLVMLVGAIGLLKRLKWGLWIVRAMFFFSLLCSLVYCLLWIKNVLETILETGIPVFFATFILALGGVAASLIVGGNVAILWLLFRPSVAKQFKEHLHLT